MKSIEIPVGHKQNKLTVTRNLGKDSRNKSMYECTCECGNIKLVEKSKILGNRMPRSCGCSSAPACTKFQVGDKYGSLTIIKESDRVGVTNKRVVTCQCECGNFVDVQTNNLSSGNTKTCGCSRGTHKLSNSRVYNIYEGMIRRCKPENSGMFPHHAGKGITVCDRWKESFENFFTDMGEVPEGLSLDRIDGNLGYYKENCRWATASVQGYNKGLDPNNTSGKTGVSFYNQHQKWSAEIHVEGKRIRLGMFDNFDDAVTARIKGELQYYGWRKSS